MTVKNKGGLSIAIGIEIKCVCLTKNCGVKVLHLMTVNDYDMPIVIGIEKKHVCEHV